MDIRYVILLAVWAASLASVGFWQNGVGHVEERVVWQEKDRTELRNANAEIERLNNEARSEEAAKAKQLNQIAVAYEKDKEYELKKRDSVIADLRAGSIRLRDPGAGVKAGSSETSGSESSTSKCDGGQGEELSRPLGEFLVSLAIEADSVVDQLHSCQCVVKSDRGEVTPDCVSSP